MFKKLICLIVAIVIVSNMLLFTTLANTTTETGYLETVYLWDDFQSVVAETFPRVFALGETLNGWTRNGYTAEQKFSFEKEDSNIYLQFQNTTGQNNEREISKNLKGEIAAGSNVKITLKYKYPAGAANVFGLYIFGQELYFRPNKNGFYPGVAGGAQFQNATVADKWNNIEILLLSKEDADYYEYYLEGNLVASGALASRMTSSSKLLLRQKLNNSGVAHVKDKYVCFDDIKISVLEERASGEEACEAAAGTIQNLFKNPLTENVTLPFSDENGTTMTSWVSSDESVITNEGVITRDYDEDKSATLTAIISNGNFTKEYSFTVTVKVADTVYKVTELLTEDFENPEITQTTLVAPGESFNGWTRQNGDTGTGFKYEIASEADTDNQFLQYYHTGNDISDYRTFKKALSNTIPAGSRIELSFKLKKDSGYNGLFEITLGKAAFLFRMSHNYMYPGMYSNSANTAVAAIPANNWNEIKFVIVDGEESAAYEYWLNGTKVTAGIPAYGGTHSGIADTVLGEISEISMRSWTTSSNAGTANAKLCFDDIKLSVFEEELPDAVACKRVAKSLENLFAAPLTENIELPLKSQYDTTIKWHTSNEAVITETGSITRALDEDRQATLTATISRGDSYSKEYPFTVTVEEIISDEKACRETYEYYVTLLSESLENNAELSTAGLHNASVEWSSNDEDIITNKGRITRGLEDKQATLTAVIKRGEITRTETFTITIKGIGSYIEPTQDALQKIADGFLFSDISDESPFAVSKDLDLTTTYNRYEAASIEGGVKIYWESSEPSILSNDGVLNRVAKEAKTVILTATFKAASDETISATKSFSLTLLPAGKVYFYETFDTPSVPAGTSIENWNGWGASYSSPTDGINVYDSFYTIEKETDTNKVFQFYRPTSNGSSIMRTAAKKLTEAVDGGEVSLRMRVNRKNTTANSIVVWVKDSADNAMAYNLEFSKSRIRHDSNLFPMFNMHTTATSIDTWQTFEFIFKLDEQKFDCYHDGVKIAENLPMVSSFNGTLSSFVIYSTRNMGVNEACIYVDDIVMTQVTDKIQDGDAANKVAAALEAKFQGIEITEDFPLETAGDYKSTILWSSSNNDVIKVINGKGVVTNDDSDTSVTLTAEIIRGSVKIEKEVTVNVLRFTGKVAPTEEMLQKAADNFTFDELTDEKETLLTHNLNLPTVYNKGYGKKIGGINISWSSSKPNVVTDEGKITKQKYDTFLTLTAEFSAVDNPSFKVTKEFKIAVLAEGEFILNDGFDDASFDLMNKTFAETGKQIEGGSYRKEIYDGWTLVGSNPGMEMYTDTVLRYFPANPYERAYNYTRKYRGNSAGTGYTTPNVTFTYKELDGEYQSGTLYASSRFYLTNANSRIDFMLLDTKGRFSGSASTNCNIYYCAGQNLTSGDLKGIVSLNTWHTLTFVMYLSGDTKVGHRYDVFVDGVKINKNQFVTANGYPIYAIAVSSVRTSDGPDSSWYADDISIRHTSYDVTEDVSEAAMALTLPESGPLTGDITLPSKGINGTRILWSSSDENVISSGGKVYFDGNPHSVTLDATIVKEDVSVTKSFTVAVASAAESTKYEIASLKESNGIFTGATVKNNGFSGNAILITCLYSRGDLMEVRVSSLTGTPEEDVTFTKPLDTGNYLKCSIKSYIYDVDTNTTISNICSR